MRSRTRMAIGMERDKCKKYIRDRCGEKKNLTQKFYTWATSGTKNRNRKTKRNYKKGERESLG